ncbi:Transposase InsG for insertion sequence element IS4 [Pectobacterium sp. F1-1]|nr:Transposase InsG for insertion sequence element IS4 [Pectobacterium sp. F1-1]
MIEQALTLTDTVTLRKRKLPLESMVRYMNASRLQGFRCVDVDG